MSKIKNILSTLMMVVLLSGIFSSSVFASEATTGLILKVNNPTVYVDDSVGIAEEYIDANHTTPIYKNGRAYIPASPLIQKFGGKVQWDSKTKKATLTMGNKKVVLTVNSKKATVNGKAKTISAAPITHNGKLMIPVRVMNETLGMAVAWDADFQVIVIYQAAYKQDMPTKDFYYDWFIEEEEVFTVSGAYDKNGSLISIGDIVGNGMFSGEVLDTRDSEILVHWTDKSIFVPKGDEEFWALVTDTKYKGKQWVQAESVTIE